MAFAKGINRRREMVILLGACATALGFAIALLTAKAGLGLLLGWSFRNRP